VNKITDDAPKELASLFTQFSSSLASFQTELSHNLQQLSEKARSTTEFIHRLKGMSDKVTVSVVRAKKRT
jgi:hypothetical protein